MFDERRVIGTFLALFSQKIEELEEIKIKGETRISIKVVDVLPAKEEKKLLETNLLNILAEQDWQIRSFNIILEQPAIIIVTFSLYL